MNEFVYCRLLDIINYKNMNGHKFISDTYNYIVVKFKQINQSGKLMQITPDTEILWASRPAAPANDRLKKLYWKYVLKKMSIQKTKIWNWPFFETLKFWTIFSWKSLIPIIYSTCWHNKTFSPLKKQVTVNWPLFRYRLTDFAQNQYDSFN